MLDLNCIEFSTLCTWTLNTDIIHILLRTPKLATLSNLNRIRSKLTVSQTCALERVQKICLRVILGREYIGYESALEVSKLETIEVRREKRCLSFGGKCLLNSNNRSLFPRNISLHNHNLREQNLFTFVQARTERLRRSCIHYIQRLLTEYCMIIVMINIYMLLSIWQI